MRCTGESVSMSCEKRVRIQESAKNGSVGTGEILSVSSPTQRSSSEVPPHSRRGKPVQLRIRLGQ